MKCETEYYLGSAGRVKSAGAPLDIMTSFSDATGGVLNPKTAVELVQYYGELRRNPPDEVRDRFLPREDNLKGQFRNGVALTRPILKTDQGQGMFLIFETGSDSGLPLFTVASEAGYVLPENYLLKEMHEKGNPQEVTEALSELQEIFRSGDIRETQLSYERLDLACHKYGISLRRDAAVGRDGVFFIHPAASAGNILLPVEVVGVVEKEIMSMTSFFPEVVRRTKKQVARQYNLCEEKALEKPPRLPVYFQSDMHIFPNGNVVLDEMQLPDVGLFLSGLDDFGNPVMERVISGMEPIAQMVIRALGEQIREIKPQRVVIITNENAYFHEQDTLELHEIETIQRGLVQEGIRSVVKPISQVDTLTGDDMGIMMNVDPDGFEFMKMMVRQFHDDAPSIYPDPFLVYGMRGMSGYKRFELSRYSIENLKAIVSTVETDPDRAFRQLLSLDALLEKFMMNTEVVHMHVSSQATPIACYRYDVQGFHNAVKYIRDDDRVVLRAIPVTSQNVTLRDRKDRPFYSVYRFMMVGR